MNERMESRWMERGWMDEGCFGGRMDGGGGIVRGWRMNEWMKGG